MILYAIILLVFMGSNKYVKLSLNAFGVDLYYYSFKVFG